MTDNAYPNSAYGKLEQIFGRSGRLCAAAAVLQWDMETMMPPGGAHARGEQLAALNAVVHETESATEVADLLEQAEAARGELDAWQQANLREMRRRYVHRCAIPTALVERRSRATAACTVLWQKTRSANDFARLVPALDEVVALVRETALLKADALKVAPYDALLDEYEPGWTTDILDPLFDRLECELPPLVQQALEEQQQRPAPLDPEETLTKKQQQSLARTLMQKLGFDFSHGRLDTSAHPFCGGVPDDVRLTTRYGNDLSTALMGVFHETGHALYERGLPRTWRYQPVGEARGMAVHESQSLLVEMQVGRGMPFVRWLADQLRDQLGFSGTSWSAENLLARAQKVSRSLIRVDADEVTYPAHVILRYRLERQLLAGALQVRDLPEAWRAEMANLVGVVPDTDRDGCMQDIHWMDGIFGYFPTYTLGAMIAAQLYDAVRQQLPDLQERIRRGDFAPLFAWLRTNIHEKASFCSTDELLVHATGKSLDVEIYLAHLRCRYIDR